MIYTAITIIRQKLLIDDSVGSALLNPKNLVRIKPWYSEKDDLSKILESIAFEKDLRLSFTEAIKDRNFEGIATIYIKLMKIFIQNTLESQQMMATMKQWFVKQVKNNRDLKPNNIIINKNKTIILIDLDRMIKEYDNKSEKESTILLHQYISPELLEGHPFSYSTDIYSLGLLIYFIIFEEEPKYPELEDKLQKESKGHPIICELIKKCINNNATERPNITDLLNNFYIENYSKITNNEKEISTIINFNESQIHTEEYFIYWICIAECEHAISLNKLGLMYWKDDFIPQSQSRALYYLTLSADKNNILAQFNLGVIYSFDNI
ncbi:hypothetical protein M9Y10_007610 [Tritrichomonas musculus]|uniref:Protein kinase domain-containing protein n=1 Tax=Tritrichomonas musculus TaxID=1915356 RepID=A0ABR2J1U1_9EUKA